MNRKYYFGLICGGVISGFVGVKFFGFFRRLGENRVSVRNGVSMRVKFRMFLKE